MKNRPLRYANIVAKHLLQADRMQSSVVHSVRTNTMCIRAEVKNQILKMMIRSLLFGISEFII